MAETIAALATPPGVAGLSVIRISGDRAIDIAQKCFLGSRRFNVPEAQRIYFGKFYNDDALIDNVTVSIFLAPNSYTGEDAVEIGCHGGVFVYSQILDTLIEKGCKLAEPGEFTKRAFLNGKMDLTQVEAVADIIHTQSVPGVITAARQLNGKFTERLCQFRQKLLNIASLLELELDFIEEDIVFAKKDDIKEQINETLKFCNDLTTSFIESEILRSGYFVGIAGYPNSGKSTLFNSMLGRQRSITSHIPGTTRDYIEENLVIGGISVRLADTAGLRETGDIIELEGIKMVLNILEQSNMILIINDMSVSISNSEKLVKSLKIEYPGKKILLVQNKIDKVEEFDINDFEAVYISAKKSIGLDQLKNRIGSEAKKSSERVKDILINQRHSLLLKQAAKELENAIAAIENGFENELIAIDIRRAIKTFGEITGESWNEEILNNIFSKFCIGK